MIQLAVLMFWRVKGEGGNTMVAGTLGGSGFGGKMENNREVA